MSDDYYIDLKSVSLRDYAKELETAQLLPSRRILKEDVSARFAKLAAQGLADLDGVLAALKTPEKLKAFAAATGLQEDYLTVLKREIASYLPKPVDLKDFPGIDEAAVRGLEAIGIKNTKQLFDRVKTKDGRKELAAQTGIPAETILELTKLTDVCRIQWVGANFARLLVDADCGSVAKVAGADYGTLYETLVKINAERKYFKGMFGANDMMLCVLAAKRVPQVVEW